MDYSKGMRDSKMINQLNLTMKSLEFQDLLEDIYSLVILIIALY